MPKGELTRREVLIGAGAAALVATGEARAWTADLNSFAERRLTIFRDYAEWAAAPTRGPTKDRLDALDGPSRVLWISDLSPSALPGRSNVVLVRPLVLERSPVAVLAAQVRAPGSVVLSTSSIHCGAIDQKSERPELWRRLADLMATPETPGEVFLDLGGSGSGDETVHDGVDLLRRAYAEHSKDWISITCPQGPRLRIG